MNRKSGAETIRTANRITVHHSADISNGESTDVNRAATMKSLQLQIKDIKLDVAEGELTGAVRQLPQTRRSSRHLSSGVCD